MLQLLFPARAGRRVPRDLGWISGNSLATHVRPAAQGLVYGEDQGRVGGGREVVEERVVWFGIFNEGGEN